MSENTKPSTKKVVSFDAPNPIATVKVEKKEVEVADQMAEDTVKTAVTEEKPKTVPVEPTPIETTAKTEVAAAEIVNTTPAEPAPAFKEPVEAPKKEEATEVAAPAPTEASAAQEDNSGTDEVLEQLRTPAKSQRPVIDDDDKTDLIFNQVILGKRADLIEDVRKIYPTDADVKKAVSDEHSFFNEATSASVNGWSTGTANSIGQVLENKMHSGDGEPIGDTLVLQSTLASDKLADGAPSRIKHHSPVMTGKQAQMAIQARLGGIIRVNLLNSGFWVVLRAPHGSELQEIFTSIDLEGKEIGRTLGTHFALISDLYLKKKFCEVIVRHHLIQASNFVDINEPGAFMRNLSFHDYDTLVHGIVSLMTRRGMRAKLVCPKCQNIEETKIDISATKFVNMDLVSDKFRTWWSITTKPDGTAITRTEADLARYRNEVIHAENIVAQTIESGAGEKVVINLVLDIPTMQTYFNVGEMLIKDLNDTVANIADGDANKEDLVKAALAIHGYQVLAPWIKEMRVMQEDGKTLDISTRDTRAIIDYLDTSVQQNEAKDVELFDKLNQFVTDSRLNYFGSCSIECSKCHAKPESGLKNFFALDMQQIFFGLLFRRSPAAS